MPEFQYDIALSHDKNIVNGLTFGFGDSKRAKSPKVDIEMEPVKYW